MRDIELNNMLTTFIKVRCIGGPKMKKKIEEKSVLSMVYMLEVLNRRGLPVRENVRKNLNWLKKWYSQEEDEEFLELALLQICAVIKMGLVREADIALYNDICALAGTSMEELLESCAPMAKRMKISRYGIQGLIGKWMPSRKNPMKKSEVVDDIIDKLVNHREGQYYYCYERNRSGDRYPEMLENDVYKLVINREESYFFDLKQFRIYTFKD